MKRLSDQTLYEIIEVSEDAPPAEIRRACDRAAATYGPGSLVTYTLASSEESALLSSRIEEARAVLLDPDARARYDERIGVRPAASSNEASPPTPPAPPAPTPFPITGTWPAPEAGAPAQAPRHVSPGLPLEVPPSPPAEYLPAFPPAPRVEPGTPAPSPQPPPGPPAAAPIPLTLAVSAAPIPLTRPGAPILLDRVVTAPAAPPVPEGNDWSGGMLRQAREARGLTVQQVAERTRITRHHLENIEQEKFQALPAPVYLRGIIMSLARELRLDGQKVARSYLQRMGAGSDGGPGR